jgi:hypothetical protein
MAGTPSVNGLAAKTATLKTMVVATLKQIIASNHGGG